MGWSWQPAEGDTGTQMLYSTRERVLSVPAEVTSCGGALGSPHEAEETTVWLTVCEVGSIQKLWLGSFREPRG